MRSEFSPDEEAHFRSYPVAAGLLRSGGSCRLDWYDARNLVEQSGTASPRQMLRRVHPMNDDGLVTLLRSSSPDKSPSELAEILADHLDMGLTQTAVVFYFNRAFPDTPLRVLLEAGAWSRLSDGDLSTERFDDLLRQWLR